MADATAVRPEGLPNRPLRGPPFWVLRRYTGEERGTILRVFCLPTPSKLPCRAKTEAVAGARRAYFRLVRFLRIAVRKQFTNNNS